MKISKNHQTNKHIYKDKIYRDLSSSILNEYCQYLHQKLFLKQFMEAPILWPTKPIIANHGFESASFLSNVMKERIDENHPWVTDDVPNLTETEVFIGQTELLCFCLEAHQIMGLKFTELT